MTKLFSKIGIVFVLAAVAVALNVPESFAQDDGSLTKLLGRASGKSKAKKIFGIIDKDKDKSISEAELEHRKIEVFVSRDDDADNKLSRDEVKKIMSDGVFAAADADKDKSISEAEFYNSDFLKFSSVDANKDGKISFQEFVDYRQAVSSS